jgi:hypothetical protein
MSRVHALIGTTDSQQPQQPEQPVILFIKDSWSLQFFFIFCFQTEATATGETDKSSKSVTLNSLSKVHEAMSQHAVIQQLLDLSDQVSWLEGFLY